VYNAYDGRFGKLPFPELKQIIGIHAAFGKVLFLGLMPAFALYSFHIGQKRLIQSDSLAKITQLSKPIGWYSLHRTVNTIILLALTFAIFSGRMVKGKWLVVGQLTHLWYNLHLLAWVTLVLCLALHFLISVKIGGFPLILSMVDAKKRSNDTSLTDWLNKIRSLGRRD
jgi:hypothetical protein